MTLARILVLSLKHDNFYDVSIDVSIRSTEGISPAFGSVIPAADAG
jgi:hypothetical protein